jgi:hypothetical protein
MRSSESKVKLTLTLDEPDLDTQELQEQTINLREWIKKDIDVDSVELVTVKEVPLGVKALGGFLVGVLQAEVSLANVKKLLEFLRVHFSNKSIELEVEANGKKLKVKASNQQDITACIEQAQKFIEGN